jgi:hypothetical protein
VIVGHDVAAGVDDDAGAERALAHIRRLAALTGLSAEEAVKEILELVVSAALLLVIVLIVGRVGLGRAAHPAVRVLDDRLGVDVDHRGLYLLGDLAEGVGELARLGQGDLLGVARVERLALDTVGDDRPDQDAKRERDHDDKRLAKTA